MDKKHIVVLGAGITGLSTAYKLAEDGFQVTVLEKSDRVGGLARSYVRGGYTYDYGPHRFHTHNPELIELIERLLGDNLGIRERQSRIFMDNRFFFYPLKLGNLLRNLPPTVLINSFLGYLAIKAKNTLREAPDANFEDWVLNRYGRPLYRKFFGVYTEKTWGIPCTEISADWASQRITLLSFWDAIKKTVFRPKGGNTPRTYVSKFWYPKKGGIGEICRRLAEEIEKMGGRVILGADVRGLDAAGGQVERVRYHHEDAEREVQPDAVISTVPLTLLCRMMNPGPSAEVLAQINAMTHRSMVFVYLALSRDKITDDHWIYLPEDTLTVHRISEFKNFSPANAPAGETVVCCEITCDFEDEVWTCPDEKLREIAVNDLVRIGLIKKEEVIDEWSHRTRFAYPIYDLQYAERLESAKGFIEQFVNLHTAGRQGLFKYNNMDHSLEMGLEASKDLKHERRDTDKVASGSNYFG